MSPYSDEDVIAYVDGRLGGPAREAFEARLAGDPELARRVAGHGWMTRQVVAAFGTPPGDQLDEALIARLGLAEQTVVSLADHRQRRAFRPGAAMAWASALAASLVLGVFVGRSFMPPETAIRMNTAGVLSPGPALAAALDRQLSGQDGAIRIGLSFRSAEGICRSFVMPGGTSGLGCREGGRWVIPIVARPGGDAGSDAGVGGEYRLAGGEVAPAVMAEVDHRIVGDPLSAEKEVAARRAGWR